MQGEVLKQRLSQLKKASIELKSKVFNDPRVDYNIVSKILSKVQPTSSSKQIWIPQSQTTSQLQVSNQNYKSNPISSLSNHSLNYSHNSSIFVLPPSAPNHKIQKTNWNSRSSSEDSFQSKQIFDLDIDHLQHENQEIDSKILQLRQEINELKKIELMKEEEIWKEHLPFMFRSQKIGVFITKLSIREFDYDKIDHQIQAVELLNDRTIIMQPKGIKRQFKLNNLQQIKYIGDKKIKLQFRNDELITIYLEFGSAGQRNQWDTALYINYKIITSKDLDKSLFVQEKEVFGYVKNKSKSSLKINDDSNQNSDKIQSKKMGSIRMPQRRIEKSNASKDSHPSSRKKSQQSKSNHPLQYTLNGYTLQNNTESMQQNISSSAMSHDQRKSKDFKQLMVFEQVGESNHQSRANTSKFNNNEVNFEPFQYYPTFSHQPKPNKQAVNVEKDKQNDEHLKWQLIINELKKGFYLVKYAKDGYKPHNKLVSINNEEEMIICANSQNLSQRKAIPIQNVKTVKYNCLGEGIRKHIKDAKTENYCVIQYVQHGNTKYLELGCQKKQFIQRFAEYLSQFLKQKGILIHD